MATKEKKNERVEVTRRIASKLNDVTPRALEGALLQEAAWAARNGFAEEAREIVAHIDQHREQATPEPILCSTEPRFYPIARQIPVGMYPRLHCLDAEMLQFIARHRDESSADGGYVPDVAIVAVAGPPDTGRTTIIMDAIAALRLRYAFEFAVPSPPTFELFREALLSIAGIPTALIFKAQSLSDAHKLKELLSSLVVRRSLRASVVFLELRDTASVGRGSRYVSRDDRFPLRMSACTYTKLITAEEATHILHSQLQLRLGHLSMNDALLDIDWERYRVDEHGHRTAGMCYRAARLLVSDYKLKGRLITEEAVKEAFLYS